MTWLTWRQFRAAAAMLAAALAALAAILALTGPGLADDYATGIAACTTQSGGCSDFVPQFFDHHQGSFLAVTAVVLLLPALIGLFWGAPLLARELEAGTHRLVWNQSITRTRWLAVKLAVTGLATMTAAGLGSLVVSWWASPIDKAAHTFNFPVPMSSGPCAPSGPPEQTLSACLAEITRLGYRQQVTSQPSSRFWPFQWYETGIYTAITLGLAGFCFWRIRRRLS
jgi:hypothetical protein